MSVLGILGLAVVAVWSSYRTAVQAAETQARNLNRVLASDYADLFDRVDLGLKLLADALNRDRRAGALDLGRLVELVDRLGAYNPDISGYRILDTNGQVVVESNGAVGHEPRVGQSEFLLRTQANNKALTVGLTSGATAQRPDLAMGRAVTNQDGSFAGIVLADIPNATLGQIFAGLHLDEKGSAALYDPDLVTMARHPAPAGAEPAVGRSTVSVPVREMIAANGGAATTTSVSAVDGETRITDFRRVGTYPISVSVALAASDYLAAWRTNALLIAGLGVALIAVIAAAAVRIRGLEHERDHAGQMLIDSWQRYQSLFYHSPVPIWVYDASSLKFLAVNDAACRNYGYDRAAFLGMTLRDIRPVDDLPEFDRAIRVPGKGVDRGEARHCRKDGSVMEIEFASYPVKFGEIDARVSVVTDITAHKEAERQRSLAANVFAHVREALLITDPNERIIDVNPTFVEVTGYSREDVIGKTPRILQSGIQDKEFYRAMWREIGQTGFWRGELWNRRKSGELLIERATIAAVKNTAGVVTQYVGLFTDITANKRYETELRGLAYSDALTQLPNRYSLRDRLDGALDRQRRDGGLLAVCFIDLDGFKLVNDRLGHAAGDQLLAVVARRIQSHLRVGDTVSRLGGDEFVLVLSSLRHREECERPLERIVGAIKAPVEVAGETAEVSASIGVAFAPDDGDNLEELLRNADAAMYAAKASGRNRWVYFQPGMDPTRDRQFTT